LKFSNLIVYFADFIEWVSYDHSKLW